MKVTAEIAAQVRAELVDRAPRVQVGYSSGKLVLFNVADVTDLFSATLFKLDTEDIVAFAGPLVSA